MNIIPEKALLLRQKFVAEQCLDEPVNLDRSGGRIDLSQGKAPQLTNRLAQQNRLGQQITEPRLHVRDCLNEHVTRNRLSTKESTTTQQIRTFGQLLDEFG